MSFKKLVIGAAAVLSLAACSKSNDGARVGAVSAPALDNNGQAVGTYTAGTPYYTFSVASLTTSMDGQAIKDKSSFSDPNIASEVSSLSAVDKVIQTKEQSLELWSAGNILVAFDLRSGSPTLLSTGSNFQISSASFVMNASDQKQGQGLSSADLTLNLQDCAVEQKQEQGKQDQGQDQGKAPIDQGKQDQGKAPIDQGKQDQGKQDQGKAAPIDQGKQDQGKQDQGKKSMVADVAGVQGQGQGQQQGKEQPKQEQGKPVEKAPSCHTVTMVYHLTEIAQPKQEQDQGKQDQGKQDQGKAPIDQGKQDQGKQDQGKAPIDQGKQDQGKQDQGKAPIDQGKQDQGKQDQGKAPIDQGKQGKQDQGKQDQGKAPMDQGKQGQDQSKK